MKIHDFSFAAGERSLFVYKRKQTCPWFIRWLAHSFSYYFEDVDTVSEENIPDTVIQEHVLLD